MRVDDLLGPQLDYYVACAEGLIADLIRANGMAYCRVDIPHQGHQVYVPTHNWQLLGPIVKRQKYLIYPRLDSETGEIVWLAEAQLNARFHGMYIADEPELALCRLRIAEAFGDDVLCP
jgi:hypothetical protein